MLLMQEIELKFQIPEDTLAAVRAELARINQGQNTDLRLRASYFDTPDRHLASARMALRVRQEGDEWVQTLKAGGSNTMMRLEDNRPTKAVAKGHAIQPDLGLHLGGQTQEALERVLRWSPEHDPSGQQTGLVELYGTDMVRTRAQITVAPGTPDEGVVELALDIGHIHAGALQVLVRELEIESISGSPMAVILAGRDWVQRHGLWLDTQTKAHRGDRLARQAAALQQSIKGLLLPYSACATHVTLAHPARITPDASLEQAWRAGLESCLEHISGNLSELATAPVDVQSVAYEFRSGLRRLRAFGKLWSGTHWALPPSTLDKAGMLGQQLGYWRDQVALAWLPAKLIEVGGPSLPVPCPPAPLAQPKNELALARGHLATDLCLDLLTVLFTPHEAHVHHKGANAEPLSKWLPRQLYLWQLRLSRRANRFNKLQVDDLHSLRKQGRRLRLVTALYAPLWKGKPFKRHDAALKATLDRLGRIHDEVVAQRWYSELAEKDELALFGRDWLQQRHKALRKRAHRALSRWLKLSSPW
jgi:triphosphatase